MVDNIDGFDNAVFGSGFGSTVEGNEEEIAQEEEVAQEEEIAQEEIAEEEIEQEEVEQEEVEQVPVEKIRMGNREYEIGDGAGQVSAAVAHQYRASQREASQWKSEAQSAQAHKEEVKQLKSQMATLMDLVKGKTEDKPVETSLSPDLNALVNELDSDFGAEGKIRRLVEIIDVNARKSVMEQWGKPMAEKMAALEQLARGHDEVVMSQREVIEARNDVSAIRSYLDENPQEGISAEDVYAAMRSKMAQQIERGLPENEVYSVTNKSTLFDNSLKDLMLEQYRSGKISSNGASVHPVKSGVRPSATVTNMPNGSGGVIPRKGPIRSISANDRALGIR